MINENFVILGFILTLIGGFSYLVDTVKGKIKPNRVSWFLWAVAPLIAFYAEIKQGVGIQSLMTFSVGFVPLLVFFATFTNKKSVWKLGRLDLMCGLLSIIGLVLWQITKIGNIAISFSILADGLAAIPTVVKSYTAPESENYKVYLFSMANAILTLFTINVWNFAHYAFPFYILLIDVILFVLIKFRLGKILSYT